MSRIIRRRERGQAAVEFAIFAVALILCMFLVVQIAWIGLQKWQFQHFAAYAARVWSVHTDWGAEKSLITIQAASITSKWELFSHDWVKAMWSDGEDTKDFSGEDDVPGVSYTGIAPLMPLYQGVIGETLLDTSIPPEVSSEFPGIDLPSSGLIRFETFIPMEREPTEEPGDGRDNDCNETPCDSGNVR